MYIVMIPMMIYFIKIKRRQRFELTILLFMIVKYGLYALFEADFT